MSSLILRILAAIILLIGAIFGVLFYLDNLTPTTVNVLGQPLAEFQLALWLIMFFVAGCIAGWVIASAQTLKYRYQLNRARKQQPISTHSNEVSTTRAPLLNS